MIVSNMNDVICAYRKYFRKRLLNIKYAQLSPVFTDATLRINIANSSGEINILIFNNAIRAYRKYFRKGVAT